MVGVGADSSSSQTVADESILVVNGFGVFCIAGFSTTKLLEVAVMEVGWWMRKRQ